MVICLDRDLICIWFVWCHYHSIISCFIKIQIGLIFLVLTYPGYPGKVAVKQVFVGQLGVTDISSVIQLCVRVVVYSWSLIALLYSQWCNLGVHLKSFKIKYRMSRKLDCRLCMQDICSWTFNLWRWACAVTKIQFFLFCCVTNYNVQIFVRVDCSHRGHAHITFTRDN